MVQSSEINSVEPVGLPMTIEHLAVNGTLMRGLELNDHLLQLNAVFVREDLTAPLYRLWSIADRHPAMQRVNQGGQSIALEIWAVPIAGIATLLQQEPAGLCLGKIFLANGEIVLGILGEAFLCEGQKDITAWGGWRAYITANSEYHQLEVT